MKNEYTPNVWCLVKHHGETKVLGSWRGGYLDGDSWRLNSGIVSVEDDGDAWVFHGNSGSAYRCRKGAYGYSPYAAASLPSDVDIKGVESTLEFIEGLTKPESSDTVTT
jgi:hypothetical protein